MYGRGIVGVVLLCAVAGCRTHGVEFHNPELSPDGQRVVYESNHDGKFAVYVINLDGSGERRLTDIAANNEQPAWSPDGAQIVFFSGRDGKQQLYVMDSAGGSQRRITNRDGNDYNAHFNPAGDRIAFMAARGGIQRQHDIDVVHADGSGRTRLTDGKADYMGPRWSPDGSKIVYVRGTGDNASHDVFVMNADGSGPVNLTHNAVRDFHPRWSRDGSSICFKSMRDGPLAVYVMNADGSNPRKRQPSGDPADVTTCGDEPIVVYEAVVDGKSGIYVFERGSGQTRRLVGAS